CRCQCDLHMRMTDKYSRNGGGEPEYSSSDVHPFCCVDIDIVEISTVINGDDADIDNFCGTVESQMVMSSGPRMIVTFRTYQPPQRATADYRGFLGLYSFVN
ncbi:PREDICTED: uncharacterized protein LOC106820295, partial [Priapulus caudatus]|uniref:Uncharacterized protein LOC106820295 n=1 Tax=Priapulus caudatus TaxID=37621 RepID=A0ABM1F781_PRICU